MRLFSRGDIWDKSVLDSRPSHTRGGATHPRIPPPRTYRSEDAVLATAGACWAPGCIQQAPAYPAIVPPAREPLPCPARVPRKRKDTPGTSPAEPRPRENPGGQVPHRAAAYSSAAPLATRAPSCRASQASTECWPRRRPTVLGTSLPLSPSPLFPRSPGWALLFRTALEPLPCHPPPHPPSSSPHLPPLLPFILFISLIFFRILLIRYSPSIPSIPHGSHPPSSINS